MDEFVILSYPDEYNDPQEIAEILGFSVPYLRNQANKLGLRRNAHYKGYWVDDTYFRRWNHDMAYILGFLVADGELARDGTYVKIDLAYKDKDILDFISSKITPGYELKTSNRNEIRWYPASSTLRGDLIKLGLVPSKTGKEVYPCQMPDEFFWDFVRGYFDGDGYVLDNCAEFTCASEDFLKTLMNRAKIGRMGKKSKIYYTWTIEDKLQMQVFYDNLYFTGSFSLQRKRKRIEYLLTNRPRFKRYTKEEDGYLKSNRNNRTIFELAMVLDRQPTSIKNRLRYLGIRKEN